MAFTPEQQMQILRATGLSVDTGVTVDTSLPACQPGYETNEQGLSFNGKFQCQPPAQVYTAPRNPVIPTSYTGDPGFSCPTPGSGDCLASIPRTDVTEEIGFDNGPDNVEIIPIENARGMRLGSITGLYIFTFSTTPPTEQEFDLYLRNLAFSSSITLRFRDQDVPGYTEIPLGDVVTLPISGCCEEAEGLCIDCEVPLYGGLELEWNSGGLAMPAFLENQGLLLRARFSGCGCKCAKPKGGCGCGV